MVGLIGSKLKKIWKTLVCKLSLQGMIFEVTSIVAFGCFANNHHNLLTCSKQFDFAFITYMYFP